MRRSLLVVQPPVSKDTPLVLTWGQFNVSDVDSATANSAVQIQSLPVAGTLQTLVDGDWKSVVVSQIISERRHRWGNCAMSRSQSKSRYDGTVSQGLGTSAMIGRGSALRRFRAHRLRLPTLTLKQTSCHQGRGGKCDRMDTAHRFQGFPPACRTWAKTVQRRPGTIHLCRAGWHVSGADPATTFNSTNDTRWSEYRGGG